MGEDGDAGEKQNQNSNSKNPKANSKQQKHQQLALSWEEDWGQA